MATYGLKEARRFAQVYLQTMDAERAAEAIGAQNGALMLAQPEITEQLNAQRKMLCEQLRPEDVVRTLAALAFGRSNDCVKLVLEAQPDVETLDLRLLSEVRRNDKGTVEVKLLDRAALLTQLQKLVSGNNDEAERFLRAMSGACENG